MFKDTNPGCVAGGCGGCVSGCVSTTYTLTVRGSGGTLLSGATVVVTGIGTFTTNAFGQVVIPITANGTYSFTVNRTGYATFSSTFTITGCANGSRSITLTPAAGYGNCAFCSDDVSPSPWFVTDENGTWPIWTSGTTTPGVCSGYALGSVGKDVDTCIGPNTCTVGAGVTNRCYYFIGHTGGSVNYMYQIGSSGGLPTLNLTFAYTYGVTACPGGPPSYTPGPYKTWHNTGAFVIGSILPVTPACSSCLFIDTPSKPLTTTSSNLITLSGSCSSAGATFTGTMPSLAYSNPNATTPDDGPLLSVGSSVILHS